MPRFPSHERLLVGAAIALGSIRILAALMVGRSSKPRSPSRPSCSSEARGRALGSLGVVHDDGRGGNAFCTIGIGEGCATVHVEQPSRSSWSTLETIETATACAGAAASYVLRRIAFHAGSFAPGIDESVFRELHTADAGRMIDDVQRWFATHTTALFELGYRLCHRRVAFSTTELVTWVNAGRGYRGAVVPTSAMFGRADVGDAVAHAVGLAIETETLGDRELVVIDSWPRGGVVRATSHAGFARGQHDHAHEALLLHWIGWA
jgi:hypothetical protein